MLQETQGEEREGDNGFEMSITGDFTRETPEAAEAYIEG